MHTHKYMDTHTFTYTCISICISPALSLSERVSWRLFWFPLSSGNWLFELFSSLFCFCFLVCCLFLFFSHAVMYVGASSAASYSMLFSISTTYCFPWRMRNIGLSYFACLKLEDFFWLILFKTALFFIRMKTSLGWYWFVLPKLHNYRRWPWKGETGRTEAKVSWA